MPKVSGATSVSYTHLHGHPDRMRVSDTDRGHEIQEHIDELQALLHAYREGLIKEHSLV